MAGKGKGNWKDALNRGKDYATRDDLYKTLEKTMTRPNYAEFKQVMATEVADQQVFILKEIPEESPLSKAPIYKATGLEKETIPNCWEALEKDHKFEVPSTKKSSSRKKGSKKKPPEMVQFKSDIYASHFDETLKFELPKGPPTQLRAQTEQIFRSVSAPKGPLPARPATGWRTLVMYDEDNYYGQRHLYYHHLSSKTCQQVNPKLLHPGLFRPTPESIATHPLPANWRYVSTMGKPELPENLKSRLQEAQENPKKPLTNAEMKTILTTVSSAPKCAVSEKGNVITHHFREEAFFINSLYKTVSRYDPRTFDAKRALFKAFRQVNVQKNCQDVCINEESNQAILASMYGHLASWSIAELHPSLGISNVTRGHEAQYRGLWVRQYQNEELNAAVDIGGVTKNLFTQLGDLWLDKSLALFEATFYELVEIDFIGACNLPRAAFEEIKKIDAQLKEVQLEKNKLILAKLKAAKVEKTINDPANWKYLKYYYVFGRFLGLAIFLNIELGFHLGPTILGPLRGLKNIPWSHFDAHLAPYYPDPQNNNEGMQASMKRVIDETLENPQAWKTEVKDGSDVVDAFSKKHPQGIIYYVFNDVGGTIQRPAPQIFDGANRTGTANFPSQQNAVQKMSQFVCQFAFERQAAAIANGVKDVIPLEWLRLFTEHELRLLIGGDRHFDADDFMTYVQFLPLREGRPTPEETAFFGELRPALKKKLSDDKFAQRLLFFASGRRYAPVGGFVKLQPAFTFQMVDTRDNVDQRTGNRAEPNLDNQLPKAHTCFNKIDLTSFLRSPKAREEMKEIGTGGEAFFNWFDKRILSDKHVASLNAV